jgi:hypothetical protein
MVHLVRFQVDTFLLCAGAFIPYLKSISVLRTLSKVLLCFEPRLKFPYYSDQYFTYDTYHTVVNPDQAYLKYSRY